MSTNHQRRASQLRFWDTAMRHQQDYLWMVNLVSKPEFHRVDGKSAKIKLGGDKEMKLIWSFVFHCFFSLRLGG